MSRDKKGVSPKTGVSSPVSIKAKEESLSRELVEDLALHDLVNLTDFISITDAFGMFEIDRLHLCDDAVRQENSKNYAFELRELE